MKTLIQLELYKIFRKPRTYIAFAAITALVVIIQVGFYLDGETFLDFTLLSLRSSFAVEGNIMNGYFMCYIILQLLLIHVPILIALVAGDMVSGEANMGTLRLLLTKPVSRSGFLMSKFIAASVYTLVLLIWMALLGLGLSMIIFGTDDLVVMRSEVVTFVLEEDVLWRYAAAFAFATLAMLTVASLAFMLAYFLKILSDPSCLRCALLYYLPFSPPLTCRYFRLCGLFCSPLICWAGRAFSTYR